MTEAVKKWYRVTYLTDREPPKTLEQTTFKDLFPKDGDLIADYSVFELTNQGDTK